MVLLFQYFPLAIQKLKYIGHKPLMSLHLMAAIEALEAKTDAAGKKNLDEAFMWYKKFLGFQVVGGEGNGSFSDIAN